MTDGKLWYVVIRIPQCFCCNSQLIVNKVSNLSDPMLLCFYIHAIYLVWCDAISVHLNLSGSTKKLLKVFCDKRIIFLTRYLKKWTITNSTAYFLILSAENSKISKLSQNKCICILHWLSKIWTIFTFTCWLQNYLTSP